MRERRCCSSKQLRSKISMGTYDQIQPPGNCTPTPTDYEAGCAREPIWALYRAEISLATIGNRTSIPCPSYYTDSFMVLIRLIQTPRLPAPLRSFTSTTESAPAGTTFSCCFLTVFLCHKCKNYSISVQKIFNSPSLLEKKTLTWRGYSSPW
jgi:hypothetical protein